MDLPSASSLSHMPLSPVAPSPAAAVHQLAVTDISARDLNSALRIVYFSHPRDKETERSDKKIDASPLAEQTKQAMKKSIRGSLGMTRRDQRPFAQVRSSRLTSGQVARDKMAHIDRMLASGAGYALHDLGGDAKAIQVKRSHLSDSQKAELVRYKELLAFYSNTTGFDLTLSTRDIERCLERTGFCAIHDNVMGDIHSQAVLLARSPQQIMFLNQLHEDFRPVDEEEGLVGGEMLQQNRLYFAKSSRHFDEAQEVIIADYNARAPLFSSRMVDLYANAADETKHAQALYNRQFTIAPSGYGCSFKTASDLEEAVLGSDLRSLMQKHVEAVACLAMKEKNLPLGQPIAEQEIWSSSDFPNKEAAAAPPVAIQRATAIRIQDRPGKPA